DLSWVYAINWLAETPHRFGREVNFTYGPLGFLFLPTNFGEHVLWSALFRLFSAIAFAAALALMRPIAWCLVLFGIFFGVAAAFGLPLEMQLLVTIALWAWLSLRKDSTVLLAATRAIAAPHVLVKFSLEAAIFSTVFTAAGLHALAARSARWRKFGIPVAAHLVSALLCCVLVLSPGSVLPWFRASVEMASGYSASMSFVPVRPRAALG